MRTEDPPSYGVTRRRKSQDELDLYAEEVAVLGFAVAPSGLNAAELDALRASSDEIYARQADGQADGMGAEEDIVRCPLAYDDRFLAPATLPVVIGVAHRLLGQNLVLLQQNAIINQPRSIQHQSRWHRDLPYQHFVGSEALAMNALLCVDDFTLETGGTFVLPGSHLFEEFPSSAYVARHEVPVEAVAGSVIMMHAMLYHRAGANVSAAPRRGINHLVGRPLLAQQIDIPRMLGGRFAQDPVLGPYLGYRWNPAVDVASWREGRV